MTCIMARESAYSGEMVTWDRIMASQLDLQPKAFDYKLKMADGEVPEPGKYKTDLTIIHGRCVRS